MYVAFQPHISVNPSSSGTRTSQSPFADDKYKSCFPLTPHFCLRPHKCVSFMAFGRGLSTTVSVAVAAISAIFVFLLLNPSSKQLGWIRYSAADLVLRNATIYTSDASIPFTEAMAVRNGRILRVGSDASVQQVQDLIGWRTREMNLEGKVVLPGFIDSHVHLIFGGLQVIPITGRLGLELARSSLAYS